MLYDQADPANLRDRFWHALSHSPYVMLQSGSDPRSAAPMTAQLDDQARHAIWFFTTRDNHLATAGAAMATCAAKGHDLSARFEGTLCHEPDRDCLARLWNGLVATRYPVGKVDPALLLLRMDLGAAEIWTGTVGALGRIGLALGLDPSPTIRASHVQTRL